MSEAIETCNMGVCGSNKNSEKLVFNPVLAQTDPSQLLAYFDSSQNDISPKLKPLFENALSTHSKSDPEISLKFVVLSVVQTLHLAKVLPYYQNLKSLRLWKTRLGAEGAKVLAPVLIFLPRLEVLSLEDNQLLSEGVAAIASALIHLSKLRKLVLPVNKIGGDGGKRLAPVFAANSKLQELMLDENSLGPGGFAELMGGLEICARSLKILGIAHNNLQSEGGRTLLDALPRFVALEKVTLSGNKIGDEIEKTLFQRAQKVQFFF